MGRKGMIETLFDGFGEPVCGPLTSVVYCPDASIGDS